MISACEGVNKCHFQPYQKILFFNNNDKCEKHYANIMKLKDRINKPAPTMRTVILSDMKREKANKVFEQRLKENISGPGGLSRQCRLELQRLRSNARVVERDLIRLNSDMYKMATTPRRSYAQKVSTSENINFSKLTHLQSHRQPTPTALSQEMESVTTTTTSSILLLSLIRPCSEQEQQESITFPLLQQSPQIHSFEGRKLSTKQHYSNEKENYFSEFLLRKYNLKQLLIQNCKQTKSKTRYYNNMSPREKFKIGK
ncbi:unnamed protein product [Didymodactylos carnosus]|nr:unnamed protein product [Didymodactylos carnosus]CAF4319529.1 unnamed protein product [Didymodactylos carnosus]